LAAGGLVGGVDQQVLVELMEIPGFDLFNWFSGKSLSLFS
jgi:hypothetical protein